MHWGRAQKCLKGKTRKFKVEVQESVVRWAEVEVEVPLLEPGFVNDDPYDNMRLYEEIQEAVWNANLDWDEDCNDSHLKIKPVES